MKVRSGHQWLSEGFPGDAHLELGWRTAALGDGPTGLWVWDCSFFDAVCSLFLIAVYHFCCLQPKKLNDRVGDQTQIKSCSQCVRFSISVSFCHTAHLSGMGVWFGWVMVCPLFCLSFKVTERLLLPRTDLFSLLGLGFVGYRFTCV
jgi:hypothetical protein